jgi:hypothetical protein
MKHTKGIAIATTILSLLALNAVGQSVPNLVNYQGRLTDQTGTALPPGSYSIQFKLWDLPNGGNLVWGQQQTLIVQPGGTFNVILGSAGGSPIPAAATNDLNGSFTATNRYLGLTVVSNNGVAIASPAEILPRQQIMTVPYAVSAGIAASVVPGSVTTASLAAGAVQANNIADGSVTLPKLAPRAVGTNVGINVAIGGLAISPSCATNAVPSANQGDWVDITNLVVTLVTTGRPVHLEAIPDNDTRSYTNSGIYCRIYNTGEMQFTFTRNDTPVGTTIDFNPYYGQGIPPLLTTVDWQAPSGTNTYKLQLRRLGGTSEVRNVRLIAYEF